MGLWDCVPEPVLVPDGVPVEVWVDVEVMIFDAVFELVCVCVEDRLGVEVRVWLFEPVWEEVR